MLFHTKYDKYKNDATIHDFFFKTTSKNQLKISDITCSYKIDYRESFFVTFACSYITNYNV